MPVLQVPEPDAVLWPTLGPQVCRFIREALVHGPGDLRGQPARLDKEKEYLLYRIYEVWPQGAPNAGRRRFRRVGISLRKGSAKSELAAWIAAVELHPQGPVRCVGWDEAGNPIGGPVTDPYIPMVAYTEEQSDELCYAALRVCIEEGPLRDDFDVGLLRIIRKTGDGRAVSLAAAPDARDGARTTFQIADESHRWTTERLRKAHRTMLANLPKRRLADPWGLEITTAPAPGEGSVAESTMEYARAVLEKRAPDTQLYFYHRQATDGCDLSTPEAIRAAVLEASGPVAEWSDIDGIVDQWSDPTADMAYLQRVWLNQLVRAADQAFDGERWRTLANPHAIPDGELITLGFDGSRYHDATGIIATHVKSGYQWVVGAWERPYRVEKWEVPVAEVEAAMREAFSRWQVWRLYADPPYWETHVDAWAGEYGRERVHEWRTNRLVPMAWAIRGYQNAMVDGEITHDGDPMFARHIGNACRQYIGRQDEQGQRLYVVTKERGDSPRKIDLSVAAILSWEARRDAIADGQLVENDERSVYEDRGVLVL